MEWSFFHLVFGLMLYASSSLWVSAFALQRKYASRHDPPSAITVEIVAENIAPAVVASIPPMPMSAVLCVSLSACLFSIAATLFGT